MSHEPDLLPRDYDGRRTLRALALALAVLALLEIGFRAVAPWVSGNLVHVRDFDRILSELVGAPAPRVVFLGNSLTNNAIQPGYFGELAASYSGQPITTAKLVPDGTTLWDWHCLISRLPPTVDSDLLIIGYGWGQVADQEPVRISQTFGLMCPLTSLPEVSRYHALGVGSWLEAGLAKLSLIYVLRERIRNGILGPLVPHYEAQAQRLNDRARNEDGAGAPTQQPSPRTYGMLLTAVARARDLGYRPVLVAMPTIRPYATDPALPNILRELEVAYFDFRREPWLREDLFLDPIHLGPEGARLLTSTLARRLYGQSEPPVIDRISAAR